MMGRNEGYSLAIEVETAIADHCDRCLANPRLEADHPLWKLLAEHHRKAVEKLEAAKGVVALEQLAMLIVESEMKALHDEVLPKFVNGPDHAA